MDYNFGPNASHMMAVCEAADVIIVEVNENMPGIPCEMVCYIIYFKDLRFS